MELSIIAGRRHFKPRTLDTLSTSDPLCILIIRLRCWHCAALIAHNAARLCNTYIHNTRNAQSSQIVHFSLCLVGPGPPHHLSMRRVASSCKATDWNFTLAASHRIMRRHNLHICTICTFAHVYASTLAISDKQSHIVELPDMHSWIHPSRLDRDTDFGTFQLEVAYSIHTVL